MNYIINPSVFYWMSVLNGVRTIGVSLLAVAIVGLIVLVAIVMTCLDYGFDDSDKKKITIVAKIAFPLLIVGSLIIVFIPDKQTMMEMLIAKTATVENAEWTVDAVKQAVDYIVNAIQTLK